ncbi:toll/interleukin-1 receptor domain-containing protein [Actinobacillus equuli]|uniref:toll/interleukin-1 receptor domain-containing protein n=1 Tax=Actinobacillus equuli TaxID=718 RepID=UPI00244147B1|nr:toll/interleukin-1 receptor domain-containing protein [Actinobacillus equuli]WGE45994.1 toll/interleukin-1 receptor domain-containing protein [Actinobacillus equuli subsp. haemolyticus]
MNKLTYVFKGDYANRVQEKLFLHDVMSTFNQDEITGIGVKVNNNPWNLELFIFITIDTNYLQRDRFLKWLSINYEERSITHNVFLMGLMTGGNIRTFIDSSSLISFDSAFIWNEDQARLFNALPLEVLDSISGETRAEFEKKHPQYASTAFQEPAVFISHSSLDKNSIALPISDYLCSKEIPIWLDKNEINLEGKITNKILYQKIYDGISLCKAGIFIITENFFKSRWAKIELFICKRLNKKIILLVDSESYNNLDSLKEYCEFQLANVLEINFSNQDYLEKIINHI